MTMSGRLDFWSRRRAAVRTEAEEAVRAEAAVDEAAARSIEEPQPRSDEEILAELGLKDPDLLGAGDDFKAFMQAAVPERIRRRALRRLWVSNPVLANLDGLVDHGEDFTDAATVVPDLATVYRVGKGMLREVVALADAEAVDEPAPGGTAPDEALEDAEVSAGPEAAEHETVAEDRAEAPIGRRHMRFDFAS